MRSLKFPNMFSTNSTNAWTSKEYLEATTQNVTVFLHCERGEFDCDPYFGVATKHFMFDQNNYVLRDAFADMLYTQLATFFPQLSLKREDIRVYKEAKKGALHCYIKGINQIDYQVNTFNLTLFENSELIK